MQEYNTQWRNKFNLLTNTTYFTWNNQLEKIWHIAPNEIQLTEQYLEQATHMIDNDQPNSFMPSDVSFDSSTKYVLIYYSQHNILVTYHVDDFTKR